MPFVQPQLAHMWVLIMHMLQAAGSTPVYIPDSPDSPLRRRRRSRY